MRPKNGEGLSHKSKIPCAEKFTHRNVHDGIGTKSVSAHAGGKNRIFFACKGGSPSPSTALPESTMRKQGLLSGTVNGLSEEKTAQEGLKDARICMVCIAFLLFGNC